MLYFSHQWKLKQKRNFVAAVTLVFKILFFWIYGYYKSKNNKREDWNIVLIHKDKIDNQLQQLTHIIQANFIARDLVNKPHNYLTAENFADEIVSTTLNTSIKTEVFDKKKIEALKMGGLLGVNKGSIHPPTFTIIEYAPENAVNTQPYVLVGKGVVLMQEESI